MKKLYSLLVMMLVGFAATWADTATFGTDFSSTNWTTVTDGTAYSMTNDGVTLLWEKGSSSTAMSQGMTDGHVRIYKGAQFTVSSASNSITQIVVTPVSNYSATNLTVDGTALGSDGTWTGTASSVTFVAGAQVRVSTIEVTFSGEAPVVETYTINYNQMENGSVTGPASAAGGATVTLTVTPDTGYELETLTVEDEDDNAITVTNNAFTMPAGDVYVSATFAEAAPVTGGTITFVQTSKTAGTLTGAPEGVSYTFSNTGTNANDQLTANNSMTLTISGMPSTYKVTGVTLEVKNNASKGDGSATITMNGNEIGSMQITGLGNTYQEQAVEITETPFSGDFVITIAATVNSVYCDKFIITYAEVSGDEPVVIATPSISGTTPFEGETEVTITAADGLSIYYTIDGSDPTVNSTLYEGAFTINATTTVKAIATDGTNVSSIASKEFTKIEPVMSIADFIGSTGTQTFGIPVVALGQNGSNLYIVDENNTAGLLVYGTIDQTYSFGDVIPAGFSGTYLLFRSQHELASPAGFAASTAQATLTPMEASISDISHVNFGRYAVLRGATISETTITVGSETVELYNRFGVTAPTDGGTYDIYGVISIYNEGAQFLPISFEAVDVPEPTKYAIEIDDQIVNGSIEADKAEAAEGETVTLTVTPATGYELEAITVLDDEANEVEVSANYTFEMPASNVIVSATFVEQGEQPAVTGGSMTFVQTSKDAGTLTGAPEGVTATFNNTYTGNKEQLTANNSMTLTISGMTSAYKVTGVTLEVHNNSSKGKGTAVVTMNGDEIGSMTITGLGTTYQEKAVEITETVFNGNLVITISATENSVFCDKFVIDYAAAEPVTEEFYITATPPAGTYEGPQTVFLEGHNGEIDQATYTINEGAEKTYDAQTGILIEKSCTLSVFALDGDANEATLEAAYVITYPELEVTLTPEAGTYYEAQNVKVAVANVYDDGEYLVSYKIGEGAEQEYDAEAGIDITESCTLTISVEATYQSFEQSYEYVITEAPSPLEGNGFVKLQSSAELISGQYLIVYEADEATGYALKSSLDEIDAASNYVEVAIANGIIEATDATKAIALTFDAEVGSFKAANGLYIGHSGSKNTLNTFDSATALNVSINADASAEIAQPNSTYHLRFNASAGQERFRFFTTEQKPIALYILREEPVATTDMAEVTEAGEYVVTVGNVVAFDDDAQTVYTTDGQENWLPILIEDADLYAEAKAAATLSQIAGSFDASKTAPLFTATAFKAEGEFVENSQEIYTFDLSDDKAVIDPKAGQVIKIKGIWYGGELRAYSGANGGNRGRSFTVLGATDLVEGTAYSIPVAVTLKAAWDEEAPAGAPKRVAKDGDAAFQNLQGKIVGGADMIEGVSTAVTDLNSDKAISGVQYVNVAGQVSAEPFEGVNIVVTTYVDGSRSAVKVVR